MTRLNIVLVWCTVVFVRVQNTAGEDILICYVLANKSLKQRIIIISIECKNLKKSEDDKKINIGLPEVQEKEKEKEEKEEAGGVLIR